jgi:hypothetical protein
MPANAVYNAFNLSNSTPAVPSGAGNQNVKWQNDSSTPPNISSYVTMTPLSPDTYPVPPNAANDEFDGSVFDTAGTRFAGATPWVWLNQPSGATATLASGYLNLNALNSGTFNATAIAQAQAGAAWEYQMKYTCRASGFSSYNDTGMIVYNSGNGHYVSIGILSNAGSATTRFIQVDEWSSFTNSVSQPAVTSNIVTGNQWYEIPFYYFSVVLSGGNVAYRYSNDGVVFYTLYTLALATYPGAVTHIGMYCGPSTNTDTLSILVDWFRRIS